MTKSHAAVFFFLARVIEREGGRIRPESFPELRPANFHNYSRDYARCEMRIKARINVDPRAGSNGISNARENEQCTVVMHLHWNVSTSFASKVTLLYTRDPDDVMLRPQCVVNRSYG